MITKRNAEVLRIAYSLVIDGISPTLQEIAEAAGINHRSAWRHLVVLQKAGFLYRSKGQWRGIRFLRMTEKLMGVA